ncbi:LamG domain-containing protein [Sphaerisporangium fuscum]|uniref:LamG domain-containing protein n=1 Tax=Sphaerisporangium fuscum TaxID=2835868 RepID=UPI001BDD5251|nr:LamG domain-containing protein [Sphaerisporangium fuscum]
MARRLGRRVQVQAAGSETTEVFADPDGDLTAEIHPFPVRARRGDGWAAIDTTLRRRADGRMEPVAVAADVSLSGGGEGPLATIRRHGRTLSFNWPAPLPSPDLDGPKATYRDVLPGVDLVAEVTEAGFSEVLVVKNAEAARDPRLRRLRFGVSADGLKMRVGKNGGLSALDARGRTLVSSAGPWMWDSTRQGGAVGEGRRRPIGVEVTGGGIDLIPDAGLLTDRTAVFPLYIDPSFEVLEQHWVLVSEAYPSASWVDSGFNARSGASPDETVNGVFAPFYRSFFQLFTAPLIGKIIKTAKFQAFVERAYDCTPAEWQLWRTGPISVETTWQNQPSWLRKIGSKSDSHGGDPVKCQPDMVGFDLTSFLTEELAAGSETVTIGLRGAEATHTGGKEFRLRDLIFAVEYNTAPEVPKPVETSGGMRCAQDWTGVHVRTTTPELNVTLYDAEQRVRATYEWQAEDGTPLGSVSTEYGTPDVGHTVVIPDGVLTNGGRYRWHARADDGDATTAWSPWCQFTVDTQPPATSPVISSAELPAGSRNGWQYQPATFTFTAGGSADVVAFKYGLNTYPATLVTADTPGGKAAVTLTSTRSGSNYVSAQGIDRAGNSGPIRTYSFTLQRVSGPIAWWQLNDGSGGTATDSAGNLHPVTFLGGATWSAGRGDGGMRLDGTTGEGTTGHPVVDTTKSFTVMGWVKLDNRNSDWPILTQDGPGASGLALAYNWLSQRWSLCVRPPDGESCALANTTAQAGAWTHVAGVYDAERHELRVHVNGRLAGTAPYTGSFSADGPLRLGKMTRSDGFAWFLPGEMDDVRVFGRVVSPTELRLLMAGPSYLPSGEWKLDEGAGSVLADETGDGHTMVTSPSGTSWTTGRHGGALHLDGAGGYAYAAGPVLRTDRSFSVATWVRLASLRDYAAAVSQDGDDDGSAFSLGYKKNWGRWNFAVAGDADHRDGAYSNSLPVAGVWTHLAGVYDAGMGQVRLYVDGRLAGSAAQPSAGASGGSFVAGAGRGSGMRTTFWPGDLDDVHVVDRVLSAGEIQQIMNASPTTPGGIFRLDEGAGTTTADASGNGNTLQVADDVAWTGGVLGSSLAFNGSATRGANANGPLIRTDTDFTVAAWVRRDARTPKARAVALSQDGQVNSGFRLGYDADLDRWEIDAPKSDSSGAPTVRVTSRSLALTGRWTHLAGVLKAETGMLQLYVDGVLQGSATLYRTWTATGSFAIGRGQRDGWWGDNWAGAVDDVRVGQFAASAAQVREMYGMPDPPAPGSIKIRSVGSGLCLTEQGGPSGFLYQGSCDAVTPAQTLETTGSAHRVTTLHPLYGPGCMGLDPYWSTTRPADGSCADTIDTTLLLKPVISPLRGFQIVFSDLGRCLAIAGDSTASGADTTFATCDPTSRGQIFAFDTR